MISIYYIEKRENKPKIYILCKQQRNEILKSFYFNSTSPQTLFRKEILYVNIYINIYRIFSFYGQNT